MNHVEYRGKKFEIKNSSLSLSGQNIADISEIKDLGDQVNLISLNLNNNKIKNINSLSYLVNLEKLFLNHNQIKYYRLAFLFFLSGYIKDSRYCFIKVYRTKKE